MYETPLVTMPCLAFSVSRRPGDNGATDIHDFLISKSERFKLTRCSVCNTNLSYTTGKRVYKSALVFMKQWSSTSYTEGGWGIQLTKIFRRSYDCICISDLWHLQWVCRINHDDWPYKVSWQVLRSRSSCGKTGECLPVICGSITITEPAMKLEGETAYYASFDNL